jgi:hypothetical protein
MRQDRGTLGRTTSRSSSARPRSCRPTSSGTLFDPFTPTPPSLTPAQCAWCLASTRLPWTFFCGCCSGAGPKQPPASFHQISGSLMLLSIIIRTDWGPAEQQGKDPGSGRKVALDGRKCAQHQGTFIRISNQQTRARTHTHTTMMDHDVRHYLHPCKSGDSGRKNLEERQHPLLFLCRLVYTYLCIHSSHARVFSWCFFSLLTVRRSTEQGLRSSWEERKAQSTRAGHYPQRSILRNLTMQTWHPLQLNDDYDYDYGGGDGSLGDGGVGGSIYSNQNLLMQTPSAVLEAHTMPNL